MKTTIKSIIVIALTAAIFSGCKKEPGPAGTNGTNGNANVVSGTVTINSSSWGYSAPSYYGDITYSAITQSIIDKGAVLVYLSNGSGGYSQLPLTIYPSSTYSETYQVVNALGSVRIYITDSDLTAPAAPSTKTFKIVVIAAALIKQHVNYKDYSEVKAAYDLKD